MARLPLNRDQRELLGLLTSDLQNQLEASLTLAEPDYSANACEESAGQCASYAEAASLLGLEGLATAWRLLESNLRQLARMESRHTEHQQLLDTWLMHFLDYLQQLAQGELEADAPARLADFLAQPAWPVPLTDTESLTQALGSIALSADTGKNLPTTATSDMLNLALSEDINPELFEGLMLELPNQVNRFAEYLDAYVQQADGQALAAAQRIAHTIKGSANVVGISGLANLMHFSEDLLEELARHPDARDAGIATLLSEVSDTLASQLDTLLEGRDQAPEALSVMQRLLDTYHQLRNQETPPEFTAPADDALPDSTARVDIPAADDGTASAPDTREAPATQPGHLQDNLATQLRIRESTAQDLLRLAGTSAISTHRLQTQLDQLQQQLAQLGQLQQRLGQLTEDLGHQVEVRDFFKDRTHSTGNELDPLELDRYNELHSFFHQLQEFATDSRDTLAQARQQLRGLEEETYAQHQTNREVQNLLLNMSMVPAQSLEARFQRCVRQACRLTGKQARLQIDGSDTLIDNQLLQALLDPVMHLLRNAVDHGLETSEVRQAMGKEDQGCIRLDFRNQGQAVVVTLSDDGGGLKRERILARAQALGLLKPDASLDQLGDSDLQQLIFTPGFSTSEQVNQTSGRGIGLDMVADRIHQLNGRISLDSGEGEGCRFTLRLPMTLITEQGLLVKLGNRQLAIANRGLSQLLYLDGESLEINEQQCLYRFGETDIQVVPLASLTALPGLRPQDPRNAQALLLVDTHPGQQLAIAVEQVAASQEMVVKPLPAYAPPVSGIIGATILGDGQVAPVVDLQQLALDYLGAGNTSASLPLLPQDADASRPPLVLVVDDSLSTRRSLSQFVTDMGLDVATAKDGFEAVELLEQRLPSLLLVDMEMPRMNGLELSAHLRARDETQHLPIVMITSRNSDKHRRLAHQAGVDHYLCKPFAEDELQACIHRSLAGDARLASSHG